MTLEEYFGEWMKVIDKEELLKVTKNINILYKTKRCSPQYKDIFKAFHVTPYNNLHTIMVFQDPYPNNMATGIAIGNRNDAISFSPSLEVLKEAAIDYTVPHYGLQFDNTLESWSKQGILMLNTALTVEINRIGSHVILWRPFISKFLKNLSNYNTGIVYVLFGKQAQTFKPYIREQFNHVFEVEHPAYFARNGRKMPHELFINISNIVEGIYGVPIEWYKEY